jgi:AcrR family transcriptional regulator
MTSMNPAPQAETHLPKGTKAQASKTAIVAAARGCFAAKGLFDSSMQDIQTAAGISRGALYYHFKSKDEIIKTVIEQNLGSMASRIETIVHESEKNQLALENILIELTAFAEQITFGPGRGMAFHVWSYAMINNEIRQIMVDFFNRIQTLLEQVINLMQNKGHISKKLAPNVAATALFGLVIPGFTVQRSFLAERSIDAKTYIETMFTVFKD